MPYKRSAARESAARREKALRKSFTYAKIRTRKLPTYVRDAIFHNCVFQLSALLEDYIYQLTSEWLQRLVTEKGLTSSLPLITRAIYTNRKQEIHFKKFFVSGDEHQLAARNVEIFTKSSLFQKETSLPNLDFKEQLLKDKKFPTPNNVESIFKRLGLPNILIVLSPRIRADAALRLRGFMDVRNVLAHESPPSLTDEDVKRYFEQIDDLINALDREFFAHVVKSSGRRFWG